jgi:hypothetical protein
MAIQMRFSARFDAVNPVFPELTARGTVEQVSRFFRRHALSIEYGA